MPNTRVTEPQRGTCRRCQKPITDAGRGFYHDVPDVSIPAHFAEPMNIMSREASA